MDGIESVWEGANNIECTVTVTVTPRVMRIEGKDVALAPGMAVTKNLPASMKDKHPEVPWQKIHGLVNLLRHEYHRIDAAILWSIVSEHLDGLDQAAISLLAAENGGT